MGNRVWVLSLLTVLTVLTTAKEVHAEKVHAEKVQARAMAGVGAALADPALTDPADEAPEALEGGAPLEGRSLPVLEGVVAGGAAAAGAAAALTLIAASAFGAVVTAIMMYSVPNVPAPLSVGEGLFVLSLIGLGALSTAALPALATGAALFTVVEGWIPIAVGASAATGAFAFAVPTALAAAVAAGVLIDEDFALFPLAAGPLFILGSTAGAAGLGAFVACDLLGGRAVEATDAVGALVE